MGLGISLDDVCNLFLSVLISQPLVLLSLVFQYALDNAKQLSIAHLCSIILSFARLNFQPSGSEDFFNMVTCLLFPSVSTFLLFGVSGKAARILA